VPQVNIILMIIFGSNFATVNPTDPQSIATFTLSLFSAAFGISKNFSMRPVRLIPYDKINLGFFLMMVNVAFCLVGKGVLLAFSQISGPHSPRNIGYGYTISVWVS
jgi:hypothetical protein